VDVPLIAYVTQGVIESPHLAGRTITMGSPEKIPERRRIAAEIGRRIIGGEWAKGQRLPGTKVFAAEYKVSEATIYQAFEILRGDGLVRGVRGGRYRA
jgi:DNA-binding GntR family transcriptional regulator